MEKSLAALRGELAATRAQADKLASAINDAKAAPGGGAAPAIDLSAINERIAEIERATRAQAAEITQQGSKIAAAKPADAKPADDVPLRRLVAAALLDVLVRVGDPYAAALAATKSLSAECRRAEAARSVCGVRRAERERAVPRIAHARAKTQSACRRTIPRPPAPASSTACRRAPPNWCASSAPMPPATIAAAWWRGSPRLALRNDLAEARRELKTLPPADRAPAQAWLDKADARDAALAASRKFASDAMAALAQARQ